MKVLLPTKNKIKIEKWGSLIKELGYELVTLNDLMETYEEPKENGNSVTENAVIKAAFYYKKTGLVTVTTDSSLYIDGLSKEDQIGLFAGRKVEADGNGKILSEGKLTDDENYERFKETIGKLGGKVKGHFDEAIVVYYGTNTYDSKVFTMDRCFKAPGSSVSKPNAPMRSFTYYEDVDKYRSELSNEEANHYEGNTFIEQTNFFKSSLKKANNLTDYNFNMLVKRMVDSNANIDMNRFRELLTSIQDPCICIGTGGSHGASLFASKVLALKNKIISTNLEPRDILYQELNGYRNLLAVRYGNNNYGINRALDTASLKGLRTFVLTANNKLNSRDEMMSYKGSLEREYSFISLASTLTPMSIMLKYYLDINDMELNYMIEQLYSNSKDNSNLMTESGSLACFGEDMRVIEVMSGDNTYVAAEILKSTMVEAGIGVPVIHEKYRYCHGNSTLSYHHKGNILVYLLNGKETELDNKLLLEIAPYYEDVITLRSDCKDKIIGEFDLAFKSLFLCKDMASNMNKDLSKVKYSPVVKRLYNYKGGM